jgi:hypothetical protein
MGPYEYIVENINGDYAFLRRTDIYDMGEPFMIAIALLPEGVEIGTKLHWENMEYSMIG